MVQSVGELEVELAGLSGLLTAPTKGECVFCYAYRMMTGFGCDNTLRWAKHWRGLCAPRAVALERMLAAGGGYCDCEIFMNGWTASPAITTINPETEDEVWPDPMPACPGARPRSTQPCPLWLPTSRRSGGQW